MVSPDTTDIGSVGAPKQVESEPVGADCYEQKAMHGEGGQPDQEREFQGLVPPAETRLAGLPAWRPTGRRFVCNGGPSVAVLKLKRAVFTTELFSRNAQKFRRPNSVGW